MLTVHDAEDRVTIEFNFPELADAVARMPTDRVLGLAVLALALAVLVLAWSKKK